MIDITSLEDLALLRESVTIECKLAQGRDGKGALPEDFWPTYSALANTEGGMVVLGMRERRGQFELVGIENLDKVRTELFNNLNNRQKVSLNLLDDSRVREWTMAGKTLLLVEIPRARRQQRPVYLTRNPFEGNTYRRLHEGDRPLPDEEVKRMLAEQVEDSRDDRLMKGYGFDDLDMTSFRTYRQVFANRGPGHPWNEDNDQVFLRNVGGWRLDRENGDSGLTLAGLLMFGQMSVIQEALPHYMLDYQERPAARTERRWIDRLTLDGQWSGNLYDFYRKVYLKLTADLKVPFQLEKGERQDETLVHIALREALANVLVHADYSDRASVLVVKRPDMFGFRNPGLMRIPVEVALHGGEPDCRNRNLHKMFRLVGVGEQAGTGIPRILQGWHSQHWNPPKLYESTSPYNQTLLEMRMIDLFPPAVIAGLRTHFGSLFDQRSHQEQVALALAGSEGTVNHARLCTVSSAHPVELTRTLRHLTQLGMLDSTGSGRGAVYCLTGQDMPTPDDVFGPLPRAGTPRSLVLDTSSSGLPASFPGLPASFPGLPASSPGLPASSPGLPASSPAMDGMPAVCSQHHNEHGYLLTDQLPLPVINDLNVLSAPLRQRLEMLARAPRQKKKMNRAEFEKVVLSVCEGHYLTLHALAGLLNRKPQSLRNEYLTPMLRTRNLSMAFPTTPTHEQQAYCATSSLLATQYKAN
jgi:predicted HTH transcriptional regulator